MARFDPRPAVLALLEAFRDGEPVSGLPEGAGPATPAQGRRVAHALVRALDLAVVGFRAVADGPGGILTTGPLFETRLAHSGISMPLAALPCLEASAACFFPLQRALPPVPEPFSLRRVLATIGPARAAIDLASWRTRERPQTVAGRIADLAGLGMVVLGDRPRGAAAIRPGAARLACDDGPLVELDLTPALLAAAEAARRAGGLPAGAGLVLAGLRPLGVPEPGGILAVRLVGGGKASVRLA